MKRILLSSVLTILLFSCSKEEAEIYTDDSSDFTLMINPNLDKPEASLNTKHFGMYHGVVISKQANFHGKIWISLHNNNKVSALASDDTSEIYFYMDKDKSDYNSRVFHFSSKTSSFDLNVSDFNNPVIENVIIKTKPGLMSIIKDRSNHRAMSVLGVYEDDIDSSFNGTWDVISSGVLHNELGYGFYFEKIVMSNPNGTTLQEDNIFENFDYPCYGAENIQPEFENDLNGSGYIDVIAQNQQSHWGGEMAYYDIGFSNYLSEVNDDLNYESGFLGYGDEVNPFDCYIFLAHGYWAWKDRYGTITFDTSELTSSLLMNKVGPKKAVQARSMKKDFFGHYIYQLRTR